MSGLVGDPTVRDALAIAGTVLGAFGLWLAVRAHRRLGELHGRLALLAPATRGRTVLDVVDESFTEMQELREHLADALDDLDHARRESVDALRHVAVVRYDAPGAVAAHQSFSLAVLDAEGDGVVLTGIAGGTAEPRTYAKIVTRGHGDFTLTPEEREAVLLARGETQAAVRRRA